MDKYTKEFWNEHNKNKSRSSEYTKNFLKQMRNNGTLRSRKINEFNMHYMITGFVCHDKADMRRLQTRDNIVM